ncbi:MAG: hypothetical protein CVU99_01020 [Firmicutes bacterium HGW-Firmicutes-4]|jgi:hypothetical protein|nr:MAG: hypothetical protein CVU99_01020 [Firmicutes bacterium HGW-Firmicutes-4]
MKSMIAACGNDCSICPRMLPKTDAELTASAELWHKIGYREQAVSNDEIKCEGCTPNTWCRHEIVSCTASRKIENCGECGDYPCNKILAAFENARHHLLDCRKCCTDAEFAIMEKAFFEKQMNLDKVRMD